MPGGGAGRLYWDVCLSRKGWEARLCSARARGAGGRRHGAAGRASPVLWEEDAPVLGALRTPSRERPVGRLRTQQDRPHSGPGSAWGPATGPCGSQPSAWDARGWRPGLEGWALPKVRSTLPLGLPPALGRGSGESPQTSIMRRVPGQAPCCSGGRGAFFPPVSPAGSLLRVLGNLRGPQALG